MAGEASPRLIIYFFISMTKEPYVWKPAVYPEPDPATQRRPDMKLYERPRQIIDGHEYLRQPRLPEVGALSVEAFIEVFTNRKGQFYATPEGAKQRCRGASLMAVRYALQAGVTDVAYLVTRDKAPDTPTEIDLWGLSGKHMPVENGFVIARSERCAQDPSLILDSAPVTGIPGLQLPPALEEAFTQSDTTDHLFVALGDGQCLDFTARQFIPDSAFPLRWELSSATLAALSNAPWSFEPAWIRLQSAARSDRRTPYPEINSQRAELLELQRDGYISPDHDFGFEELFVEIPVQQPA